MHETFGLIHRLPAQARLAIASISKLVIQNSKWDGSELARCHRAKQRERVTATALDIVQDPVIHSLLEQTKTLVDQLYQLPAGSPKIQPLERQLVAHSHYTVPATLRGERTNRLRRKLKELTTPARYGGHDSDAVLVWDTYNRMFPRQVRKPSPIAEDLALAVAELVKLQLALYDCTPKPDAASIGYIFGMFHYGAQVAKLDLNTPGSHAALNSALSMVFPNEGNACLQVIMAHECSPEFAAAATTGGNDYDIWVGTEGRAAPTSLLSLLDPRRYSRERCPPPVHP